ncbi:MAG: SMP-30/gluconolactonase/LRE family protein, partial [Limnohabitans sp.]
MSEQTLLTSAAAPGAAFAFAPSQRYPDPRIEVLHPSFAKYRIFSSTVEMLGSGMRWAEGPVWFGDGRYLLVSDIPNNRILRYDEATGGWGVFRSPSNMANGLARDAQGRLRTCEHGGRRITRTEYDG